MKVTVKWNEETYDKYLKYLEKIGEEKTKEFYNKLNNFKIYVYNQKKLMTWERPKND